MRIFLLALCLAISSQTVQGGGPLISGDFRGLTFNAFAAEVERQLPVRFVFRDEWVRDVRMTAG